MRLLLHLPVLYAGCLGYLSCANPSAAAPAPKLTPQQSDFFEKKIRPVLVKDCYKCHSAEGGRIKGGLRLDTRDGLLKGGDSGPAIVPGNPDSSLLIRAVRYRDRNLQMPPDDKKLPAAQIADLEAWVRMGAPDPRADAPNKYGAAPTDPKQHWSFQPIFKPIIPDFRKDWAPLARNAVDHYVFATLEAKQLAPSPRADKVTLIRRATFNLTGLPPTLQEVDDFVADESPNAFEKVIDRLLASPRYGERWGRHWLDVVRFGESNGFERNFIIDDLWPFRDWVIRSLNDDKPFDRFITEHLAGDVIGKDRPEVEVGSAFLVAGPYDDVGNQDPVAKANIRAATLDDMVVATSGAFLGLTVGCARCHHHKFDPVPTEDYYRLRSAFEGVTHGRREVATAEQRTAFTEATRDLNARLAVVNAGLDRVERAVAARAKERLKARVFPRPRIDPELTEEAFAPVEARHVRFVVLDNTEAPGRPPPRPREIGRAHV